MNGILGPQNARAQELIKSIERHLVHLRKATGAHELVILELEAVLQEIRSLLRSAIVDKLIQDPEARHHRPIHRPQKALCLGPTATQTHNLSATGPLDGALRDCALPIERAAMVAGFKSDHCT